MRDEDCPGAVLYEYDSEKEARDAIEEDREECDADRADPADRWVERVTVTRERLPNATTGGPAPPVSPEETFFAVQVLNGGIPEDPVILDNEADSLRYFAESVVASDFDPEDIENSLNEHYVGNDDDEIRRFGPLRRIVGPLVAPVASEWHHDKGTFVERPFTPEETAQVEAILAKLKEPAPP